MDNELALKIIYCEGKKVAQLLLEQDVKLSRLPIDVLMALGVKKNKSSWLNDIVIDELKNRIR